MSPDLRVVIATAEGSSARSVTALSATDAVTTVRTGEGEALAAVSGEPIDCLVTERALTDGDGITLIERGRERFPALPIVMYAPDGDEALASEAVSAGVTDYVPGDDPGALIDAVESAIDAGGVTAGGNGRGSRFVDRSPLAVVEWSPDGRVRRWNRAAEALFGYSRDTARGRHAAFLFPDDDAGAVEAVWNDAVDRGEPTETVVENLTQTDERLTCEWHSAPLSTGEGGIGSVLSIVQDVTEQHRHLETVAKLHEATRDLMAAQSREEIGTIAVETARDVLDMPLATLFLHDEGAGVLRPAANTNEAHETFGEPPTFEVGAGIAGDAFATGRPEVLEDGQRDERAHPDGSSAIHSYIALPLADHGVLTIASQAVGAFDESEVEVAKTLAANVEAALDRGEREATLRDRERELAQQNERLDEFATVVSHDLRNPLSVAKGNAELLAEGRDDDRVAAIEESLSRMDDLVTRLLTLARQGDVVDDPEPIALETVATDAWTTVDAAAATLRVEDGLGTVRGDESRVRQLFENLFRNAVEHAGDEVSVAVGSTEEGFYVADDGPGVPADVRDDAFESGVSTDGNAGLGLAIVGRIAEAHGWGRRIETGDRGGARFVFDVD